MGNEAALIKALKKQTKLNKVSMNGPLYRKNDIEYIEKHSILAATIRSHSESNNWNDHVTYVNFGDNRMKGAIGPHFQKAN